MMIHSNDIFNASWQKLTDIYDEAEAKNLIKWLMEDIWGVSTTDLLINKPLPEGKIHLLNQHIAQLLNHRPIQHVLGYAWFMDRKFHVNPDVLIPRQETEELVQLIISENPDFSGHLLDIGTGTGIIPISLQKKFMNASITGLDISSKALKIAQGNAHKSAHVEWIEMDILKESPESRFDIIVSNPPYVLESDKESMHSNVLGQDPDLALFVDDDDPLLFYRRICDISGSLLNPNGKVYFEIHEAFGSEVKQLMEKYGFEMVTVHQDLNGKDRMVSGIKKKE
jgi:release factor glutamine methyltransferase